MEILGDSNPSLSNLGNASFRWKVWYSLNTRQLQVSNLVEEEPMVLQMSSYTVFIPVQVWVDDLKKSMCEWALNSNVSQSLHCSFKAEHFSSHLSSGLRQKERLEKKKKKEGGLGTDMWRQLV